MDRTEHYISDDESSVGLNEMGPMQKLIVRHLVVFLMYSLFSQVSSHKTNESDSRISMSISSNLAQFLDFVHNAPEFSSYSISIGSFASLHVVTHLVTNHFAGKLVGTYHVDLCNFPSRAFANKTGVTWVITVDDAKLMKDYHRLKKDFWKSNNKFVIIFVGDCDVNFRSMFYGVWRKYELYTLLVTSVCDRFEYFYRYAPFKISDGKYGRVEKIFLGNYYKAQRNSSDFVKNREHLDCHRRSIVLDNVNTSVPGNHRSNENKNYDRIHSLIFGNDTFRCNIDDIPNEKTLRTPTKLDYQTFPEIFEDFKDLNGYSVNVMIFTSQLMQVAIRADNRIMYTSVDGKALDALQSYMNATFEINVPRKDRKDPFNEALISLETGATDLVLVGFFIRPYNTSVRWEFTVSVYEDELCLVVRSAGPFPKYLTLFMPFSLNLWWLLFFYNILVTALWLFINRAASTIRVDYSRSNGKHLIGREERVFGKYFDKVDRGPGNELSGIRRKLGKPRCARLKSKVSATPRLHPYLITLIEFLLRLIYPAHLEREMTSQRILLICTFMVGIVIVGSYQSSLTSCLSQPVMQPDYDTLEAVANSDLVIGTKYINLKTAVFTDETPTNKKLREKVKILSLEERTKDMIVSTGNMAAISRKSSFMLENLTKYYDEHGNALLHAVEESLADYLISYVVKFSSPYLRRINAILMRIQQAGLFNKWTDEVFFENTLENRKYLTKAETEIKLSLEHFSLSFLGLAVGLILSLLAFIAELYVAKH